MMLVIVVAISTVFVRKKLLFPKMKYPRRKLAAVFGDRGNGRGCESSWADNDPDVAFISTNNKATQLKLYR